MDKFMLLAYKEALKSFKMGEVPVGCVIVRNGEVIAKAHNERERRQSALCHAEILCIERTCRRLKSFRLDDCEMYLTLEPCPMCSGAIINARIKTLFFGASDKNYGCAGSRYNLLQDKSFEHTVDIVPHIMEEECVLLLQKFFKTVREKNKAKSYLNKDINYTILEQNSSENNLHFVENKKLENFEKIAKIDEKTPKNGKKSEKLPYFSIKIDNFIAKAFLFDDKKTSGKVNMIIEEIGSFNVYLLIDFTEEKVRKIISLFKAGSMLKIINEKEKRIVKV